MAEARLPGWPYQRVHAAGLAGCLVFLPWSTALLSISQMVLVANWLVQGWSQRSLGAPWRGAPLAFLSFFLLHLLGLAWSEDLGWGMDLCRILLPVAVLGTVVPAAGPLDARTFRALLLLGAYSALASAWFGILFSQGRPGDYRALSIFISHIRLALLLAMAAVAFVLLRSRRPWVNALQWAAAVACVLAIIILQSLQGLSILLITACILGWRRARRLGPLERKALRLLLVAAPLTLAAAAFGLVSKRHHALPRDLGHVPRYTIGGEPYHHDTTNTQTENGQPVWSYIAWSELHRTWPLRSRMDLGGTDALGHPLSGTLLRYLSSKGLHKDSLGVMSLSEAEVRAIEQGRTNAYDARMGPLRRRMEEVLFELDLYLHGGLADGHSAAMRMEFARAGWAIARDHLLFGVGTGDTQLAFDDYYARTGSRLSPQWRLRAHNEYLTLLISFGIPGLLLSLFSWCWPAWRTGAWRLPLFQAWAVAFAVSCLTDDTVETQAGATFFALFYCLLVFAAPRAEGAPAPARAGSA
jgi:hypothetical protein